MATLVAVSTDAGPGDPLYGLKRGTEETQLALAGDGRGQTLLDFARTRLHELEELTGSGVSALPAAGAAGPDGTVVLAADADPQLVLETLATMDAQTTEGAAWLTDRAVDTGDDVVAGPARRVERGPVRGPRRAARRRCRTRPSTSSTARWPGSAEIETRDRRPVRRARLRESACPSRRPTSSARCRASACRGTPRLRPPPAARDPGTTSRARPGLGVHRQRGGADGGCAERWREHRRPAAERWRRGRGPGRAHRRGARRRQGCRACPYACRPVPVRCRASASGSRERAARPARGRRPDRLHAHRTPRRWRSVCPRSSW